jgi:electron transfer flavoprotein alpha/beta subunit
MSPNNKTQHRPGFRSDAATRVGWTLAGHLGLDLGTQIELVTVERKGRRVFERAIMGVYSYTHTVPPLYVCMRREREKRG